MKRLGISARRASQAEAGALAHETYVSTNGYDLLGAIDSAQWGLVYSAARGALQYSVAAFVARAGHETEVGPSTWGSLRILDPQLHEAAWRLEIANPLTDDEVVAYAAECRRLCVEQLGVTPELFAGAAGSQVWYRASRQISRACKRLGVRSAVEEIVDFDATKAAEQQRSASGAS